MRKILYCNCSQADLTPDTARKAALDALDTAGVEYVYTDDLCGLCADERRAAELLEWVGNDGLTVLACYERTIGALLDRIGFRHADNLNCINLRSDTSKQTLNELNLQDVRGGGHIVFNSTDSQWQPWYPLIDDRRCKQCKQCLNFCLFGVYALDASRHVKVKQPTYCKTGCPACARVCPFAAIIFPKYTTAPINGDVVDEQGWKKSPLPADLQQRLGGNVMQMLRNRSAENPAGSLEQLKDKLDIPDYVIEGLKENKR